MQFLQPHPSLSKYLRPYLHLSHPLNKQNLDHTEYPFLHANDYESHAKFTELAHESAKHFQSGTFRTITSARLSLPPPRQAPDPKHSMLWIERLPPDCQQFFTTDYDQHFLQRMLEHLLEIDDSHSRGFEIPSPVFHGTSTEYVSFLSRYEHAGMLSWSIVKEESMT